MIKIREGVNLDYKQKKIISRIEPFTVGLDMEVTRGHSSPLDQLRVIAAYARNNDVRFREFDPAHFTEDDLHRKVVMEGRECYCWQLTWSRLLNIGVIINPPLAAECLEDYHAADGHNKKGEIILPSPHILSDPLDFSSKVNGVPNIELAINILTRAKAAGAGIRFIKPEPKNNCVHCDLEKEVT